MRFEVKKKQKRRLLGQTYR